MLSRIKLWTTISWAFGALLFTIGIVNIIYVHFLAGIVYMLLSVLYFLPTNMFLEKKFILTSPSLAKVVLGLLALGIAIGVNDLGKVLGL